MALPVSFRWDEAFVARLDAARKTPLGEVPRSAFVRDAVELAIRRAEASEAMAVDADGRFARGAVEQALGQTGPLPPDPPAPAEQPEEGRVYSDEEVRRLDPRLSFQRVPGPNVENLRSSAQAKRDVRPVPKGGKS